MCMVVRIVMMIVVVVRCVIFRYADSLRLYIAVRIGDLLLSHLIKNLELFRCYCHVEKFCGEAQFVIWSRNNSSEGASRCIINVFLCWNVLPIHIFKIHSQLCSYYYPAHGSSLCLILVILEHINQFFKVHFKYSRASKLSEFNFEGASCSIFNVSFFPKFSWSILRYWSKKLPKALISEL